MNSMRDFYLKAGIPLVTRPHKPSLFLWYHILRKIRLLPNEAQGYYHNFAYENFLAFRDEEDLRRVNEIVTKSTENVKWICKKYNIPTN
jgi:hypothetical protein